MRLPPKNNSWIPRVFCSSTFDTRSSPGSGPAARVLDDPEMISESFSYDSPVSVASKHFEDELVRPRPEHCKVVGRGAFRQRARAVK